MSNVNNLHSRSISSTIFFVACCDAADLRIALKAVPTAFSEMLLACQASGCPDHSRPG